jgi:hypothetical protein
MDPEFSQTGDSESCAGSIGPDHGPERLRAHRPSWWILRLGRHPHWQLTSVLIGLGMITVHVHLKAAKPVQGSARSAAPATSPTAFMGAEPSGVGSQVPPPRAEAGAAAEPLEDAAAAGPKSGAGDGPTPAPAVTKLDGAAVARGEAELDAASRDRARAEARATDAARRYAQASGQVALETARGRKLALRVHDPSTRIKQAAARGGFLRGQRDLLAKEVTALRRVPGPKMKTILGKSPVAKPVSSDEFHFELRRGRVSFINLDGLLALVKSDAQVRIRMSDRVPVISSQVGPVGSFSLAYELGKAIPNSIEELLERKSIRFDLRAWEIIPESENRGETLEATKNPISEFARAINRVSPSRATVTLWVYPDSFALYRQLRSDLVERGFSVAGRPLPEGMTIRGSPMGTQSAAQ